MTRNYLIFIMLLISIALMGCQDERSISFDDESSYYDEVCIKGVKYYHRYAGKTGVMSVAYDSKTGAVLSCAGDPILIEVPEVESTKPSTDNFFTIKEIMEILNKLPIEHKQEINKTLVKMIKKDSLYRIADELIE